MDEILSMHFFLLSIINLYSYNATGSASHKLKKAGPYFLYFFWNIQSCSEACISILYRIIMKVCALLIFIKTISLCTLRVYLDMRYNLKYSRESLKTKLQTCSVENSLVLRKLRTVIIRFILHVFSVLYYTLSKLSLPFI